MHRRSRLAAVAAALGVLLLVPSIALGVTVTLNGQTDGVAYTSPDFLVTGSSSVAIVVHAYNGAGTWTLHCAASSAAFSLSGTGSGASSAYSGTVTAPTGCAYAVPAHLQWTGYSGSVTPLGFAWISVTYNEALPDNQCNDVSSGVCTGGTTEVIFPPPTGGATGLVGGTVPLACPLPWTDETSCRWDPTTQTIGNMHKYIYEWEPSVWWGHGSDLPRGAVVFQSAPLRAQAGAGAWTVQANYSWGWGAGPISAACDTWNPAHTVQVVDSCSTAAPVMLTYVQWFGGAGTEAVPIGRSLVGNPPDYTVGLSAPTTGTVTPPAGAAWAMVQVECTANCAIGSHWWAVTDFAVDWSGSLSAIQDEAGCAGLYGAPGSACLGPPVPADYQWPVTDPNTGLWVCGPLSDVCSGKPYLAPVAVPVCQPGAGGLDVVGWLSFISCQVSNVPLWAQNVAIYGANIGIDLVWPSLGFADRFSERFGTQLDDKAPFAQLFGAIDQAEASLTVGGSACSGMTMTLEGTAVDICGPIADALDVVSPYRGLMAAGVWLVVLASVVSRVSGTLGAGSLPRGME